MKNILILCTGNSCRSQIAHGYFNNFSKNKAKIYSAGIETHGLNINAVKTMKRDQIDISSYRSNNVSEYLNINFDYIITVCDHANENCPYIPSKKAIRIHKNFNTWFRFIFKCINTSKRYLSTFNIFKKFLFVKDSTSG